MNRKALLVMLGLLFLAKGSFANWPTPGQPTLPFYWIQGKITGNADKLNNRRVILHGLDFSPEKSISAEVTEGSFTLNLFDLYYYCLPSDFTFPLFMSSLKKSGLFLSVIRDDSNTYGAQEVVPFDPQKGFVAVNLSLAEGAGPKAGTGQIIGKVTDKTDSNPIPGAQVNILGGAVIGTSDAFGYYGANEVAPGAYKLECSALYYKTQTNTYSTAVTANQISLANFELTPGLLPDNGYIKSIYIFPENGKIKLTWKYKNQLVTGADIYRAISNTFTKNVDDWTLVESNNQAKAFVDAGPQVVPGDGKTVYYVVMPWLNNSSVAKDKIFNLSPPVPGNYLGEKDGIPYTSWPVLKFDLSFQAGESKLMGYPFLPTGAKGFLINLSDITLQANFADGSLWHNKNGLMKLDVVGGIWNADLPINLSCGYWLMSKWAYTYTFTGALIPAAFAKEMAAGSDIYSLAFPAELGDASLDIDGGVSNGDCIWIDKQGLIKYDYTVGQWNGSFKLGPGSGFWYKTAASNKKLKTIP